MDVEHFSDEQAQKKGRHRKKQLYNSVLQQMEFYFSDSNLTKDRFLSQLITSDPYVDTETFLKFNKIRKLTTNVDDITKAVSKSELLELSEDKTKIRRKLPIQVKENVDECTIYVERLKSDTTHEWLTHIFSEFGNVVYVSIPKYKHNGMIKGFAFIEFENEDGAKAALEYFESIDCKIPSHMEPEQLCSIATYEGDGKNIPINQINDATSKENEEEDKEKIKRKKRKHSEEHKEAEDKDSSEIVKEEKKKRKHSSSSIDEGETEKKKVKTDEEAEKVKVDESMEQQEGEADDDKKKKKHKKAHRKKMNLKEIGLQILSKKDWKKMRNRYLDMQKKTMKQLKMHLNRQRFNKRYDTNKYSQSNFKHESKSENTEENGTKKPETDFVPGTIVKISLLEPCEENKKLKAEIKSYSPDVKYVDVPLPAGSQEIFVRFSETKNAHAFCESNFNKGKLSILEGDEETNYWKKIETARQSKQKRSVVKQRGRDKLLKKAEKQIATHVRFDNDSE